MRIKSLQLHGFKSFVDRTVFRFDEGITAVVGPNGCGKSNVVDAIRWVMGEQSPRRLRGKGMDDVIFVGSETRPPIGMAEISLTFDNRDHRAPAPFSEFDEIQISRRLYRSGESEYLINMTSCRLRDIQDFFRDSGIGSKGYTIVEQGKVGELVSAKPEERRQIIEEAAGIGKFKARRRESESKIQSTEQNLTRVRDVLGEIKRQISSLERQARKAAAFKRVQESLRLVELSLAAEERGELVGRVAEATGRLTRLRDQQTALAAQLSEREAAVETRRIALTEAEKAVGGATERLYGIRSQIKGFEGQVELAHRERQTLEEANGAGRQEIAKLVGKRDAAETQVAEAEAELLRIEELLATDESAREQAALEVREAVEALTACQRERDRVSEQLVGCLTAIARAEDRTAVVAERREQIAQRLRMADRDLEQQQSQATEAGRDENSLEEGLRNLLADRDRFREQLASALRRNTEANEAARAAAEVLSELRERLEAKRARHTSLREVADRLEDVSHGTRHLLAEDPAARGRYGLRGLVRELLEVDADVERALEAVLADRADAIVVDRPQGALDALASLRSAQAGRGLFIAPCASERPIGIVPLGQPLAAHVRARSGNEDIARVLLRDVYLVDSLDEAISRYGETEFPATFVTRAGDVLTPDCVIRGGEPEAASGAFKRVREVRELAIEVVRLEREVEEAEQVRGLAEALLVSVAEELENLRNREHTVALAVASHEKDLERSRERIKTLGEVQEGRVAERAELLAESEVLAEEAAALERGLIDSRSGRGERQRELDALALRLASGSREVSRVETRAAELRIAHEGRAASRDRGIGTLERARATIAEMGEWIERREREIQTASDRRALLAREIEEAEAGLAESLEAEEQARLASEDLRQHYEGQAGAVREAEDAVVVVRRDLSTSRDDASQAELVAREAEMSLQHQDQVIQEKWNVEIAHWRLPPLPDDLDAAAAPPVEAQPEQESEMAAESPEPEVSVSEAAQVRRDARRNAELARLPREQRKVELADLRRRVESLGDVNLGAIEEHEELAERFRFLTEQKDDLETTIQSLREAINRINRTSRKRFKETFEEVSKRFSENFPRLFGGGRASLMLTEAEDVLDAGVDIVAMPPGKRLQNVNLLSGGEKTMTALALLMSVFQVRPSPFFLLDEVDAALDDANVGRFNQLISELATNSQFLVITHNKRTIEVADVLYGVTMEQKGVSKVVAVDLH